MTSLIKPSVFVKYFLCLICIILFFYANHSFDMISNEFNLRNPLELGDRNLVDPLVHGFSFFEIYNLKIFFYYLTTFVLGIPFTKKIFEEFSLRKDFLIISSFIFGYMYVVIHNRLISLFIPIDYLKYAFNLSFVLHLSYLYFSKKLISFSKNDLASFLLIPFLLIILLHSVHFNIHPFSGHGDQYSSFVKYLFETFRPGIDSNGPEFLIFSEKYNYFPIIARHYDELIYNFGLSVQESKAIDPILFFWLTNGIYKISIFCLIFCSCEKLLKSSLHSLAVIIFLYFGTSSIFFNKYFVLFDSFNPFFATLHPSRLLGPLLVIFFWNLRRISQIKLNNMESSIIYLLMLYLPSGSIHNYVLLFLYFFLFFNKSIEFRSNFFIIFFVFLLLAVSSMLFSDSKIVSPKLTVLILILALLYMFKDIILNTKLLLNRKFLSYLLVFMFSFLFLGNTGTIVFNKIFNINFFEVENYFNNSNLGPTSIKFLDAPFRWSWAAYSSSVLSFLLVYSQILIFIIFYLLNAKKISNEFLISLFLFVLFLCITHYVQTFKFNWIMSRFVEVPYYFIIYFILFFFFLKMNKVFRPLLVIYLLMFSFLPFYYSGRVQQMKTNWAYLKGDRSLLKNFSFRLETRTLYRNYKGYQISYFNRKFYAHDARIDSLLKLEIHRTKSVIVSFSYKNLIKKIDKKSEYNLKKS